MNIDGKILNKYWQTKFSSMLERSYTMTKLASSEGCKDGLKYTEAKTKTS
jgi:hypothetical protein